MSCSLLPRSTPAVRVGPDFLADIDYRTIDNLRMAIEEGKLRSIVPEQRDL